jgi:hypothetical protein
MTQHTPGPWEWHWEDESMLVLHGQDVLFNMVLVTNPCEACQNRTRETGELNKCLAPNEADARLIAAAPDLLKALQDLVEDITDEDHEPGDWSVHLLVKRSHEAIAKATGEDR